jgi:hypothetical protein
MNMTVAEFLIEFLRHSDACESWCKVGIGGVVDGADADPPALFVVVPTYLCEEGARIMEKANAERRRAGEGEFSFNRVPETVHAWPGENTLLPCCGMSVLQMPKTGACSKRPEEVTCGKRAS